MRGFLECGVTGVFAVFCEGWRKTHADSEFLSSVPQTIAARPCQKNPLHLFESSPYLFDDDSNGS